MYRELWRDAYCVVCWKLRRFQRDDVGAWRCFCGADAPGILADRLTQHERQMLAAPLPLDFETDNPTEKPQ